LPQYELNFRDYIRILHKRKFLIITAVVLSIVASVIFFPEPPPIYNASTTVKIVERKTIAGLLTEWIAYSPGDIMASQTMIIKGFPIIKKVALRFGMIHSDSEASEVHKIVSSLQEKIETERIKQTNLIKIIASSNIAAEAMKIASAVAEVYVEEDLLEKTQQARNTRMFIEEQLSQLKERLRDSEDRLKRFEDEAGDLEVVKKEIIKEKKVVDPLQIKMADLRFTLSTLSQRYTQEHPRILRLKKQINDLATRQGEKQAQEIKPAEYEKKEIKVSRKDIAGKKLKYVRLAREVEVNKKLYLMFKEKLEEARINEAQKVESVSIVDPAVMPTSPITERGRMNVLIGAMMGLMLGIALAFIFESLDTSIGTIEEIEKVLQLPVLGVIPSARKKLDKVRVRSLKKLLSISSKEAQKAYIRMIVLLIPRSPIAEAYRNIRTHLKLSPSKKTILFTSAGPEEGKTTIMVNLGLAVAQTGAKTLLVSADLRRPAVARTFNMAREPGLSELLLGRASLEEVLKNVSDFLTTGPEHGSKLQGYPGIENMWLLPSGKIPSNPSEILSAQSFENIIKELEKRFDFIFFDSPPVLPVTDASLIASKVDSVLLCYEVGKISRDALVRAKGQLESVGAYISGIVLNQIKLETRAISPYPYYQDYR
jgi:tyrosine-protein kinase Etk/Wzc